MEEFKLKDSLFEGLNMTALEKEQNLESAAYKVFDSVEYRRKLSKDEKDEIKENISTLSVQIRDAEKKLKEVTDPLKGEIKKKKAEREIAVTDFKKGSKDERGRTYQIQDESSMTMHTYDRHGERISVRPLLPEERNLILKLPISSPSEKGNATGTNN